MQNTLYFYFTATWCTTIQNKLHAINLHIVQLRDYLIYAVTVNQQMCSFLKNDFA